MPSNSKSGKKSTRRSTRADDIVRECPICFKKFPIGTTELDIAMHASRCLEDSSTGRRSSRGVLSDSQTVSENVDNISTNSPSQENVESNTPLEGYYPSNISAETCKTTSDRQNLTNDTSDICSRSISQIFDQFHLYRLFSIYTNSNNTNKQTTSNRTKSKSENNQVFCQTHVWRDAESHLITPSGLNRLNSVDVSIGYTTHSHVIFQLQSNLLHINRDTKYSSWTNYFQENNRFHPPVQNSVLSHMDRLTHRSNVSGALLLASLINARTLAFYACQIPRSIQFQMNDREGVPDSIGDLLDREHLLGNPACSPLLLGNSNHISNGYNYSHENWAKQGDFVQYIFCGIVLWGKVCFVESASSSDQTTKRWPQTNVDICHIVLCSSGLRVRVAVHHLHPVTGTVIDANYWSWKKLAHDLQRESKSITSFSIHEWIEKVLHKPMKLQYSSFTNSHRTNQHNSCRVMDTYLPGLQLMSDAHTYCCQRWDELAIPQYDVMYRVLYHISKTSPGVTTEPVHPSQFWNEFLSADTIRKREIGIAATMKAFSFVIRKSEYVFADSLVPQLREQFLIWAISRCWRFGSSAPTRFNPYSLLQIPHFTHHLAWMGSSASVFRLIRAMRFRRSYDANGIRKDLSRVYDCEIPCLMEPWNQSSINRCKGNQEETSVKVTDQTISKRRRISTPQTGEHRRIALEFLEHV